MNHSQAKIWLIILVSLFAVFAALNGTAPSYGQNSTPTNVAPYAACPGAPQSQLAVNSLGVVNPSLKIVLNLRTKPAQTAAALGVLSAGEWVRVVEGPQCANNWVWWKVQSLKNNLKGWVAEGDPENYWLVPPPAPTGTPTPRPTFTRTPTINATGTSQAIRDLSTATVLAGRARATDAGLTAAAFKQTYAAKQTATAIMVKALATQAQQNLEATGQAYRDGKTATAQAAPTRTAEAYLTATAVRVTALAQATLALGQTQTASARATVRFGTVVAISAATAQARATLDAEYTLTRYYKDLSCQNKKIRVWAHVVSVTNGQVRAYTSAPNLLIFIDLQPGVNTSNLKPSAATYSLFLGTCAGTAYICAANKKCDTGAHLIDAFWLPY